MQCAAMGNAAHWLKAASNARHFCPYRAFRVVKHHDYPVRHLGLGETIGLPARHEAFGFLQAAVLRKWHHAIPVNFQTDSVIGLKTIRGVTLLSNSSCAVWCHQESNRGHKDFQSFALPTELWHHRLFAGAKVGRKSHTHKREAKKM